VKTPSPVPSVRRSSQYGKNVAWIGAIVVGRHSFVHEVSEELNWMFPFDDASAFTYACP
jgi:hypothetical protein